MHLHTFFGKRHTAPVSGNIAATSALLNAPNNVIQPATIQTLNSNKGEPNCEAMSEGFIKIPEPIMPPNYGNSGPEI